MNVSPNEIDCLCNCYFILIGKNHRLLYNLILYFLQRLTFLIRLRTVNMIERKKKRAQSFSRRIVRYHHRTRILINYFISIDIKLTCYWIWLVHCSTFTIFILCTDYNAKEKKNILSWDDVYLGYIRFQRKKYHLLLILNSIFYVIFNTPYYGTYI